MDARLRWAGVHNNILHIQNSILNVIKMGIDLGI